MTDTNNSLPLPQEPPKDQSKKTTDPSLDMIRQKVSQIYADEPSVKEEENEIQNIGATSVHQKYIQQLTSSGKSLAEIQTAWHNYYQTLSDDDKHQVWQEFYQNHNRSAKYHQVVKPDQLPNNTHAPSSQKVINKIGQIGSDLHKINQPTQPQTTKDIKDSLLKKISTRGKLSKKHNLQSIIFGVSMGLVVIFIFMFGFFNERFIAPFITPSKNASNTPIITDTSQTSSIDLADKIIIPKINVEIPVVYNVNSIDEKTIQSGLENGAVHYPTSPEPGQLGNTVIIGHSANNIFNNGKYKYAFALLNRLQEGDTFILTHGGKRYLYKIYVRKIVKPTDVSVLGPTDKPATATLITCDPPGTSINRLILVGEQVSPTPSTNVASATPNAIKEPAIIPGNPPNLLKKMFSWL